MKNSRFWTLAVKEFYGYINSPLAYMIMVPFLVISIFLFFRTALLVGDANLRPFIELLPWFLIIIGPALAMRSFGDEHREGTLELLFAHPVSEVTIVLAKFTGLILFYLVLLATTFSIPLTLMTFSAVDLGLIISQYLAALVIGGAFLAVGLATSAWIKGSIGSFLVGAAINFGLMLLGMNFIVLMFPGIFGYLVSEITPISHMASLSRGVMDLRDVLYFATLVGIALVLTIFKLTERKLTEKPQERRKLWLALLLFVAVGVLGNVAMAEFPIRLDLTTNRQFSLSRGAKELLSKVPDRVSMTLYASDNLPGPMQVTLRDVKDLLKDFERYSNQVSVTTRNIKPESQERTEALQKGIREITFNQIGTGSLQVQSGLLGLIIRYGEKTEVIDFIEDTSNLEYELSRLILKMTREDEARIGILVNSVTNQWQALAQLLGENYTVSSLNDAEEKEVASVSGLLVFDDGTGDVATAAALIAQGVAQGKNVALFTDGVAVDPQTLQTTPNQSGLSQLLQSWGLTINQNMAYDFQLNETISIPQGNVRTFYQYPFWLRALVKQESVPWTGSQNNVLLGWPSTITVESKEGITTNGILYTSPASNILTSNFTILPQQTRQLPSPQGQQLLLGVLAHKEDQRAAIIGDTQLANDEFLRGPENMAFVTNLVDWIAADPLLLLIPKRSNGRTVFQFTTPGQATFIQYANIIAPPVLVTLFGFWWLSRRRSRNRRSYMGV